MVETPPAIRLLQGTERAATSMPWVFMSYGSNTSGTLHIASPPSVPRPPGVGGRLRTGTAPAHSGWVQGPLSKTTSR